VQRTPTEPPRFVADKTLGRLARWLRLIGCDVLYGSNFSGKGLLAAARAEKRLVLTRERRVLSRPQAPPGILVESDHFRDQLRQVVAACGIDPLARLFERCAECNGVLDEISRDDVRGRVPQFVYETQQVFRRCGDCGHLYWQATHVARVRNELDRMGLASGNLASADEKH
jgi:uncharacterized protein